jgi:hypothetical protein
MSGSVRRQRLDADQRWLVQAISASRTPAAGRRLGGATVDPDIGLGIYRHAYCARLRECLADDFPVLAGLMGSDAFQELADVVVSRLPPQAATLNRYGRRLVQLLMREPQVTRFGKVASDLARLEWALVEAIHARAEPSITAEDLGRIAPVAWPTVRFRPVASLRRVASSWAIDTCVRQHFRKQPITIPDDRQSGTVVVVRNSEGLQRRVMEPRAARFLARLVRGRPFGEAVSIPGFSPEALQAACATCISGGFFAALVCESPRLSGKSLKQGS